MDDDRGATLVEYAMMVALVAVVCIGAIQALQDRSEAKLDDGANDRGLPSEQLHLPSGIGVIIGGGAGSSVGSGAADVHTFEISGTSDTANPNWAATVTIKVKNVSTPDLWAGVTVNGTWVYSQSGPGGSLTPMAQPATCTTDDSGSCSVTLSGLKQSGNGSVASVSFDGVVLSAPPGSGITFQPQPGDPTSSGPIAAP